MIEKALRIVITVLAGVGGLLTADRVLLMLPQGVLPDFARIGFFGVTVGTIVFYLVGGLLGALLGYILSPWMSGFVWRYSVWMETKLMKMPLNDVLAGLLGLGAGLIIANLLGNAFSKIPVIGDYIPVIFSIVLGYLGIHIMIKKRKEIVELFDFLPRFVKEYSKNKEIKNAAPAAAMAGTVATPPPVAENKLYKLLDTSVIIDGRIADICQSGFIEGTLLIPVFVLEELQHIADSSDLLKRTRGRRGLDILQRIRTESHMQVEIDNRDFDDITEVDSKLVRLGQIVGGKIITNDYNLNKVSELRGVPVLNINELSNAVKPVVIPGETMRVNVVKEGKESGQGVAYLDDGTMIVIENGRRHINTTIDVEVTSALQTAAGRMIFAKPK